jgi:hypothetical protein
MNFSIFRKEYSLSILRKKKNSRRGAILNYKTLIFSKINNAIFLR